MIVENRNQMYDDDSADVFMMWNRTEKNIDNGKLQTKRVIFVWFVFSVSVSHFFLFPHYYYYTYTHLYTTVCTHTRCQRIVLIWIYIEKRDAAGKNIRQSLCQYH